MFKRYRINSVCQNSFRFKWIEILLTQRSLYHYFFFLRIYSFSKHNSINTNTHFIVLPLQVSAGGNFELQILEISNTNSHILSGYCCGVPLNIRSTRTTGCPQCATAFRLCLKEYQQNTVQTQPGILNGCSFGNVTSGVIGGSSFVLSDLVVKSGSLVLPFTFRWTVSFIFISNSIDIFSLISTFWTNRNQKCKKGVYRLWYPSLFIPAVYLC